MGASQPTVSSSTLHGEVKPVPIGVGGDPAERTIHVVDQVVEILACELAQATPIRQDPGRIRQPLEDPHEQLVAEVRLQATKILGGDEGTPSPSMIAPNWSVSTSRTSLVVATLVRSIPPSWMRPSACQSSSGLLRHVPLVIPIAPSFRTTEGSRGSIPICSRRTVAIPARSGPGPIVVTTSYESSLLLRPGSDARRGIASIA
jgi:hypothetical protein